MGPAVFNERAAAGGWPSAFTRARDEPETTDEKREGQDRSAMAAQEACLPAPFEITFEFVVS